MIEALKDAFHEVAQLPEDEQRYIIEMIRATIASERRWHTLFQDPGSKHLLASLMAEALTENTVGETEEIGGDNFLS